MDASVVLYGELPEIRTAQNVVREWAEEDPTAYANAVIEWAEPDLAKVADDLASAELATEYQPSYQANEDGSISIAIEIFTNGELDYGTSLEVSAPQLKEAPWLDAVVSQRFS